MQAAPDEGATALAWLSWNFEMQVLYLPNYSKTNPYQSLLAAALARYNVSVTLPRETDPVPIRNVLKKYGVPEIIHLHWPSPYMIDDKLTKSLFKISRFMVDLGAAKQMGVRLIWTVHNLSEHTHRHPQLETAANQLLLRLLDQIIVHSVASTQALCRNYWFPANIKSKITVLPHGNYIAAYENSMAREQARHRLKLRDDEFCYLCFGSIKRYKGVFDLIDAFRLLAKEAPNIRLVLAGKPAWDMTVSGVEEYCRQDPRIQTHLKFIPASEVQVFFNAADVVILPYQDILTSGAVILAMSFSRAVIAPRLGCIPEVLANGWGMYDSSGKAGLLQTMKQALQVNLPAIGSHNLTLAKKMEWEPIAKETYRVYQKCLKRPDPLERGIL
jgi:beta-1,4-mannosyltransferase